MKATEQYFPKMLFIMLYKVVLTFESVDEILKCDHSNESYWVVLSCGAVYYAVQDGSNFWVCDWNPAGWPCIYVGSVKFGKFVQFVLDRSYSAPPWRMNKVISVARQAICTTHLLQYAQILNKFGSQLMTVLNFFFWLCWTVHGNVALFSFHARLGGSLVMRTPRLQREQQRREQLAVVLRAMTSVD